MYRIMISVDGCVIDETRASFIPDVRDIIELNSVRYSIIKREIRYNEDREEALLFVYVEG